MAIQKKNWDENSLKTQQQQQENSISMHQSSIIDASSSVETAQAMSAAYSRMMYNFLPYTSAAVSANAAAAAANNVAAISATTGFYQNAAVVNASAVMGMFQGRASGPSFSGNGKSVYLSSLRGFLYYGYLRFFFISLKKVILKILNVKKKTQTSIKNCENISFLNLI